MVPFIENHPLLRENTGKYCSKCANNHVQFFIQTTVLKQMASTIQAHGFMVCPLPPFYCYLGAISP